MASIRKRGQDRWQVQIRLEGQSSKTKTFRNRKDAAQWARTVEAQIVSGLVQTRQLDTKAPLRVYLHRYLKEITPTKKGSTQEASRLNMLLLSTLASVPIAQVRSSEVATWRNLRLQSNGPATVSRELAILSHVYTIARKEWGLEGLVNPIMGIRRPKSPKGRDRRLSPEELSSVLDSSQSSQLKAIILLSVETAMRRSEICSIEWQNVDLENRRIVLSDSKNGEQRSVPLSGAARTLIASLSPQPKGKVFNLRPDSVTQAFARACERAKVSNLRLHDLRHEATSRLFEKGLNVIEAASVTGHKDLRMLHRYTHLNPLKLAEKLDRAVLGCEH